MKNRNHKRLPFAAVAVVFLISGCSSISNAQNATQPLKTEVSVTTDKILKDGKSVPAKTFTLDEETAKWLHQKQADLKKTIGSTVGLNQDKVLVALTPSDSDSKAACSIVLNTDAKVESKLVDKIREDVMKVFMEESTGEKISEENIVITNIKGEKL